MSSVTEHSFLFIFTELFIPSRSITKMTLKTKQDLSKYSSLIWGGVGGEEGLVGFLIT